MKMKKIKDITLSELFSKCPLINTPIAQCSRACVYFDICNGNPDKLSFQEAMLRDSNVADDGTVVTLEVEGETLPTDECLENNYDSHSIIIDHVENLTINM